jgi:hypothetical protein
MDPTAFDRFSRAIASAGSRRRLLEALSGLSLALALPHVAAPPSLAGPKKKSKKKSGKKKSGKKSPISQQSPTCALGCTPEKRLDTTTCTCVCPAVHTCCTCVIRTGPNETQSTCLGDAVDSHVACLARCVSLLGPDDELESAFFGGGPGSSVTCGAGFEEPCSFECRGANICGTRDLCAGEQERCAPDGFCFRPLGGGPSRCGSIGTGNCVSDAECRAALNDPGAFCADTPDCGSLSPTRCVFSR